MLDRKTGRTSGSSSCRQRTEARDAMPVAIPAQPAAALAEHALIATS